LLTLAIAGCSKEIKYDLVPVKGTVKINGTPAANIFVQCMPDIMAGTKGPTSTGITDVNGNFELKTERNEVGAVPGKHVVILSDMDEERPAQDQVAVKPPRIDSLYTTAKGGLKVEISSGNDLSIEIPPRK
jgi:hypothetical protein